MLGSKPVLRCLQQMTRVPFSEELVEGQPPSHTTYISDETVQMLKCLLATNNF
jgi:hypothetical protein